MEDQRDKPVSPFPAVSPSPVPGYQPTQRLMQMAKRLADESTGVPAAPGSPYLARLTAGAQRDPVEVRELALSRSRFGPRLWGRDGKHILGIHRPALYMRRQMVSCTIGGTARSGGNTNNLIVDRQDALKLSGCELTVFPNNHAFASSVHGIGFSFRDACGVTFLALRQAGFPVYRSLSSVLVSEPVGIRPRAPNTHQSCYSHLHAPDFESLTGGANNRFCDISTRISGVSTKTLSEVGRLALRPGLSRKRSGKTLRDSSKRQRTIPRSAGTSTMFWPGRLCCGSTLPRLLRALSAW